MNMQGSRNNHVHMAKIHEAVQQLSNAPADLNVQGLCVYLHEVPKADANAILQYFLTGNNRCSRMTGLQLRFSDNLLPPNAPVFLSTYTDLRFLDLSCNQITAFPRDFERLVHLKTLLLGNANPHDADSLTTTPHVFPSFIKGLSRLERLDVRNFYTSVDTETAIDMYFQHLTALTHLDISGNYLHTVNRPFIHAKVFPRPV